MKRDIELCEILMTATTSGGVHTNTRYLAATSATVARVAGVVVTIRVLPVDLNPTI